MMLPACLFSFLLAPIKKRRSHCYTITMTRPRQLLCRALYDRSLPTPPRIHQQVNVCQPLRAKEQVQAMACPTIEGELHANGKVEVVVVAVKSVSGKRNPVRCHRDILCLFLA